jgi:hypothetical protein
MGLRWRRPRLSLQIHACWRWRVRLQILGLPDLAKTNLYEITATTEEDAPPDQVFGPMIVDRLEKPASN